MWLAEIGTLAFAIEDQSCWPADVPVLASSLVASTAPVASFTNVAKA
jgi:hypothetical protein